MKVRILILVLLPFLVMLSTVGSYILEFDNLFDSFWWTIVTFTTVGYGDLSPSTVGGRIFGILVLVTGVIINSAIITLVSNWYFHFQSARDRGLKHVRIRDHALICSDDREFIHSIIRENLNQVSMGKIVVVSECAENPLTGTNWKRVHWVSGQGHKASVLQKAAAHRARIAYVSFNEDSKTAMTVMQLHSMTKGKTRIMALVSHGDHSKHLEDVGCDYVLNPYDIYVPMMVKASLSPGAPEWLRQVILGESETPTIENMSVPRHAFGKTWADLTTSMAREHARLPLTLVDRNGALHTNPLGDHIMRRGDRMLVLTPPRARKFNTEVAVSCTPPPAGPILVLSDNPEFISRVLKELDLAHVTHEIIVVSAVEPFAYLADRLNYNYRWIHASSFSDEGLRLANAKAARVAFIDHEQDSHTLMAVLRLERMSDDKCFAIASYRHSGFDKRLRTVGCDFALNANELIAPILTQSGRHFGMGMLVEELISQHPQSESLFVAKLSPAWQPRTWIETMAILKAQHEYVPVALFEETSRLTVCPHVETIVRPGATLVLLTLTGNGVRDDIFEHGAEGIVQVHQDFATQYAADPERALKDLHDDAHQGNAESQYHLGTLYEKGRHLRRNPQKSLEWHQKAAKQGHSRALFKVGSFFFQGFGTDADHQKAIQCMQNSANRGYMPAQRVLDSMKTMRRSVDGKQLLNHDLLEHLKPEHKDIYLKAVIKMILIDGSIGYYEQGYFKEAVQTTRDSNLIHEIEQAVMFGEELHIDPVNDMTFLERKLVMKDLVKVALADRSFTRNEHKFLKEVGRLIHADPKLVEEEIERAEYVSHHHRAQGDVLLAPA